MKVKLLNPVDGFEEIAEFNVEYNPRDRGEWIPHQCNRGVLSLTPKPLPVVEPPKWLGVVRDKGCVGNRFVTYVGKDEWLCTVNGHGPCVGNTSMVHKREVELYRTANIPTSPELEALFKE